MAKTYFTRLTSHYYFSTGVFATLWHRAHAAKRAARLQPADKRSTRTSHGASACAPGLYASLLPFSGPWLMQVDEKCVSCGHQGLSFYTMQLRSADEGQTVFFECLKCKHTWSVNT